jgi:hypothetical protein
MGFACNVMHKVSGGCHCGNILVDVELARAPGTYYPRACDCDFCRKHDASYVSDPQGGLLIRIKDQRETGKYRQGSGSADFLFCRNCGVLVGVLYLSSERLYAALNAKVVDVGTQFGVEQTVSPKKLSGSEKMQRWQDVWFPDVSIIDV